MERELMVFFTIAAIRSTTVVEVLVWKDNDGLEDRTYHHQWYTLPYMNIVL